MLGESPCSLTAGCHLPLCHRLLWNSWDCSQFKQQDLPMAVLVTQKFSQTRIQTLLSPFQASMLIHPLHQVNYCSTDLSIFEDCLRLPYSQHPKPSLKTISASQCSHFRLVGGFNMFRPIPKISLGDHKPSAARRGDFLHPGDPTAPRSCQSGGSVEEFVAWVVNSYNSTLEVIGLRDQWMIWK